MRPARRRPNRSPGRPAARFAPFARVRSPLAAVFALVALVACDAGGKRSPSALDAGVADDRDAASVFLDDAGADALGTSADARGTGADAALPTLDGAAPTVDAGPLSEDAAAVEAPDAADAAGMPAPDAAAPPTAPPAADCVAFAGLHDAALVDALHHAVHDPYRPLEVMPDQGGTPNRYTTARHLLFTVVERLPLGEDVGPDGARGVECVYTGEFYPLAEDEEPDHTLVNTEHVRARATLNPDRESLLYSHEQSDLHHLYPSQPGANSTRGSFPFGDPVTITDDMWAPALAGLDAAGHQVFQPRPERRGDIARAMFYMTVRWGLDLPDDEEAVLRDWDAADPVDAREQARNDRVAELQGNRNPFVDCPGLAASVGDFAAFPSLDTNENLAAP